MSILAVEVARVNHLIHETSPYLLQHAHNPVDWHPWGVEALERARLENKPIFLSIGYSSCHWCHVMERESFEDERIAEFLNEFFVSIKVDREERPDLDEIYMTAVQLMTGSGGWPMSMFLTPELKPFYGGTYFPSADMSGRPGFLTILRSVAAAWEERYEAVIRSSHEIADAVKRHLGCVASEADLGDAAGLIAAKCREAAAGLGAAFDRDEGGFGGAPKFPPTPAIGFLLREHYREHDKTALDMATFTLDKMAAGGIFDHVGGGFHRYSVDDKWLVPHFEKMLYDNAQLAQAYIEAYQVTRKPLYREIAERILDYVLRDMTDDGGGFYSSEDADSEDDEGRFYLWTYDEIASVLGKKEAKAFCLHYGVRPAGNFQSNEPEHAGQNILHVVDEKTAGPPGGGTQPLAEPWLREMRETLGEARARRTRPGRDDKILTAWNALMISAFARGYQVTEDGRYRAAAERAGDFILMRMMTDNELQRTYRQGIARQPGFLDDYAFMVVSMIDLYETTFEPRWFDAASSLARKMIELFWDAREGGFYFAPPNDADLIARSKPVFDGAEPSGNAMAALGLFRLAKLAHNADFLEKARQTVETSLPVIAQMPRVFLTMLNAADFLVSSPVEIALVGTPDCEETCRVSAAALLRVLRGQFMPNKVVALLDPVGDTGLRDKIPLLKEKEMLSGNATAFVCGDFTCDAPVNTPEDFLSSLLRHRPNAKTAPN